MRWAWQVFQYFRLFWTILGLYNDVTWSKFGLRAKKFGAQIPVITASDWSCDHFVILCNTNCIINFWLKTARKFKVGRILHVEKMEVTFRWWLLWTIALPVTNRWVAVDQINVSICRFPLMYQMAKRILHKLEKTQQGSSRQCSNDNLIEFHEPFQPENSLLQMSQNSSLKLLLFTFGAKKG